MYSIFYTESARQDLLKLEKKTAQRIIKKIAFFRNQKKPLSFAKSLKNASLGQYRFCVGSYRVIFDVDTKGNLHLLMILKVTHQKDVYV